MSFSDIKSLLIIDHKIKLKFMNLAFLYIISFIAQGFIFVF